MDHPTIHFGLMFAKSEAGETWMYFLTGSSAGFLQNKQKLYICSEPSKIRVSLNCQKMRRILMRVV
jgi:hypothetical protein